MTLTPDTITDAQIRELLMLFVRESRSPKPRVWRAAVCGYETCREALGERPVPQRVCRRARARCAEILNTRSSR